MSRCVICGTALSVKAGMKKRSIRANCCSTSCSYKAYRAEKRAQKEAEEAAKDELLRALHYRPVAIVPRWQQQETTE